VVGQLYDLVVDDMELYLDVVVVADWPEDIELMGTE